MDAAASSSRRAKLAIIAAFGAFLAVGALGLVVRVPDVLPELKGVEAEPKPVAWDFAKFRLGPAEPESPQHLLEAQVNVRFGWRNFLVRLDNQVSWSLFVETRPPPLVNGAPAATHVIYGVNEWLFEKHYIQNAVTPRTFAPGPVRDAVARMKRVQDKLAARGIPFLLVVAPNKAEVYPEKVPAYLWDGRDRTHVKTKFEQVRPWFDEAGLNWIDGPALYEKWKSEGKRHLYARSGTHWSYKSAVEVLAEIRRRLNVSMRRPMPELIVSGETLAKPQLNDRDLLDLANLLLPQPYEHAVPFPRIERQRAVPDEQLPRIVWVHDSFGWPLIDPIYWGGVAAPSESFYYFNLDPTPKRIPGGAPLAEKIQDVNWPAYLAEKDAVVVVWTEIATEFMGWGFFEAVDGALE